MAEIEHIDAPVTISPQFSREARLVMLPETVTTPLSSEDMARWMQWARIFALNDVGHTTTSHGAW